MANIIFKKHIRKESRKSVNSLIDEYGIRDTGGHLLLLAFAEGDTTERNAQDIVEKEGMTFTDRFGQKKAHPLLTTIRDARAGKLAALKALNLEIEPSSSTNRFNFKSKINAGRNF